MLREQAGGGRANPVRSASDDSRFSSEHSRSGLYRKIREVPPEPLG